MSQRGYGKVSTEFVCALLVVGIAALDAVTQQGLAEPVLYATVILAAFRSSSARLIVILGVVCTALTVAGYFASSPSEEPWKAAVNRGIAVGCVWATVGIGLRWQRLVRENERLAAEREEMLTRALRQLIPICAWCKKVRDERDQWEQLDRYVARRTDTSFTHGVCPQCYEAMMPVPNDPVAASPPPK